MFVLRILCNDCTAVQNSAANSQNQEQSPCTYRMHSEL